MRLFIRYIRYRLKLLAVSALVAALFAAAFALYRLPFKAVLYPTALAFVIFCTAAALDFGRVRRRHLELSRLASLPAEIISSLPEAESIPEEDYQQLILGLRRDSELRKAEFSGRLRDMTEYYALWAHQIKTPITSMRLTLQEEDSPAARKLSADLGEIERYVDMVMAFIRLDSDTVDFVFREHSIDAIIRESVSGFAAQFISRKLRLDYTPAEGSVVTDDKWLVFVLSQLLSNALKYTPSGSVSIFMDGPRTLCIRDTGIGIAPSDLPRVFERGYTGFNGRQDKRASGIGLYLCRRICDKLGIELHLTSEQGRGTTALLYLNEVTKV